MNMFARNLQQFLKGYKLGWPVTKNKSISYKTLPIKIEKKPNEPSSSDTLNATDETISAESFNKIKELIESENKNPKAYKNIISHYHGNLNMKGADGNTLLHLAIKHSNKVALTQLLKAIRLGNTFDFLLTDQDGNTVFHLAFANPELDYQNYSDLRSAARQHYSLLRSKNPKNRYNETQLESTEFSEV